MRNTAYSKTSAIKIAKSATGLPLNKTKVSKHFPDLTDFRKSIHYKGESLTQTIIKGRG